MGRGVVAVEAGQPCCYLDHSARGQERRGADDVHGASRQLAGSPGGRRVVMAAKEYSQRLGSIEDDQFRLALERLGLGGFVRAEPVAGGLFGQNVFVASTTGEYVLRGAPHYDWQLPSERFFARLLHERTRAPVPWPYLLDPGDDIFGWSYAVMPRMPGLKPSDIAADEELTNDESLGMARSMGENLALMHALSWPRPGRYDLTTDTIAPLEESWAEWLAAE